MSSLPAAATAPAAARVVRRRSDVRLVLIFGIAALLLIAVGPYILPDFMVNNLIRGFLYAAVALTVDILWGYTGILTFGQSAFFGIGAYAAGLIFTHMGFSPEHAALALVAGILVSVAVAALIGWLAFYHGASPLYASVVTLVLPIIVAQILYSGGTFTGSSSGLSGFDSFSIEINTWFWIAGVFLVLVTAGAWLFVRSDAGRILVAIRENESRCEYLGINVSRVKILLMMASAVIAAIAGYAFAGVQMVVAPEYAGFVFGTELVIWVALGGRGTLIGPVIGTLLIDCSTAYLSGNLPFIWKLIIGLAFVVVIVALPQGIAPLIKRLFTRGRRTEANTEVPELRPSVEEPLAGLASGGQHAVALEGVRKHFGSLLVLDGIDFKARRGELLSLVGPNGAGKTTLMRCISDGGERSAGRVLINDHDIDRKPPYECVAFGVGRKFQNATTLDALTVAESLRIARTRLERPSLWTRAGSLDVPAAALQVMQATGLDQKLGIHVRHLSHGEKQALELAMVLALEPSVLLLDEPTAGLTKPERTLIGRILMQLTGTHALCILLVEHDLDFVREISSRVIVLHQGRIVLDGSVAQVVESELVRTIYSGGGAMTGGHGVNALELAGVRSGYGEAVVVHDVSLAIERGEIFVLLGKNGMGKSTLLKSVMGFLPKLCGSVKLFGEEITTQPPHRIARKAIAYTPQEQALFQDLTVEENLRLALQDDELLEPGLEQIGRYFPFIPQRQKQRAGTLSGGEQKMLLVARALMSRPRLMLVDEISEGLQPSVIERLIEVFKAERAQSQTAILLIEQHVKFALAVADRYAVLKLGEIVDRGVVTDPGAEKSIGEHLSV